MFKVQGLKFITDGVIMNRSVRMLFINYRETKALPSFFYEAKGIVTLLSQSSLLYLLHHFRIYQSGYISKIGLFAFGNFSQDAAHDLSRTRFR